MHGLHHAHLRIANRGGGLDMGADGEVSSSHGIVEGSKIRWFFICWSAPTLLSPHNAWTQRVFRAEKCERYFFKHIYFLIEDDVGSANLKLMKEDWFSLGKRYTHIPDCTGLSPETTWAHF